MNQRFFGYNRRFDTARKAKIALFTFYLIFVPAFLYIIFQPDNTNSTYAVTNSYPTLEFSNINLSTSVKPSKLNGNNLEVPDRIAASYSMNYNKTFIFGHSSSVFRNLNLVEVDDSFTYDGVEYEVVSVEYKEKDQISMKDILKSESVETVILMTCAGEPLGNNDYSERLIVIANKK